MTTASDLADELETARAALAMFSPERPMMVGPNAYKALLAEPGISDLMDRVRVNEPLPTSQALTGEA